MKIFSCVLYMHVNVIGYLELAYIFWKVNGGHSETCLLAVAVMDVFYAVCTKNQEQCLRQNFFSL